MNRIAAVLIVSLAPALLWSQETKLPTGIQAGIDAYHDAELQRRSAVQGQVELNNALRYRLPWPAPYGETVYYSGYTPSYGYSSFSGYSTAWPPLFGYGYTPLIRQPIGQRQVQTGPRRWESYPVYAEDEAPAASPPAPPTPVEPPPAPGPDPLPLKKKGPREF